MVQIREINQHISIGILDLEAFSRSGNILKKRETEKQATRFLIEQLMKENVFKLCYTPFNKPYLESRTEHISISHSHAKLAVIVNRAENTGIDIELVRDKVKLIVHKFLGAAEQEFAAMDTEKLITLWAAKEALYKVHGLKGLDFRSNLFVHPFSGNIIAGEIRVNGDVRKYSLEREKTGDYIMVYVKNEVR